MRGVNYRINWWWTGAGLVLLAAFIDIVQFILVAAAIGAILDSIIAICATMLFWILFKILNVDFVASPKRLASFALGSLGEMLPIINILPLWTVSTVITIVITRSEDKGGIIGQAAKLV